MTCAASSRGWRTDRRHAGGAFNVDGERRDGRIGVWVGQPGRMGGESKIAAIGVRVSKWVTTHGIALNVSPDLTHFDGIVPCGISDRGVTSLEDLGQIVSMPEADICLARRIRAPFRAHPGRSAGIACHRGVTAPS